MGNKLAEIREHEARTLNELWVTGHMLSSTERYVQRNVDVLTSQRETERQDTSLKHSRKSN